MKPSIVVVGFPKSGTSTLQTAFSESGIKSAHWKYGSKYVGELIYDGWFDHGDPFHFFEGIEAITQLDSCNRIEVDRPVVSLWPNLDIQLLLSIRELYPNCKFILNFRSPHETADSFSRWYDLQERVKSANCPGLPEGRGSIDELERWITSHHRALRSVFGNDDGFLEIDITSNDAKSKLEAFLGRKLRWWGIANRNRKE